MGPQKAAGLRIHMNDSNDSPKKITPGQRLRRMVDIRPSRRLRGIRELSPVESLRKVRDTRAMENLRKVGQMDVTEAVHKVREMDAAEGVRKVRELGTAEGLRKVRKIIPPVPQRFRKVKGEQRIQEAFQNIPKITNETVAEHREDILKGARKYKYPLEHSKRRIVVVSLALSILAVVGFIVYTGLSLYRFQASSAFMYRITQVIPLPVAKAGDHWVSYENYLFELRRYQHYHATQQRVDFNDQDGRDQLDSYRPTAMSQVIQAAYVKQLATEHRVSVSNAEVEAELNSLQAQNQTTRKELAEITKQFFGWSIDDLKREIKQELLAQKVAAKLDTSAQAKAKAVADQLAAGADFAALAAKHSDDTVTKDKGGEYADTAITAASTDVPAAVVRKLQTMQVGQVSTVIVTADTLEIVKLLANDKGKLRAAHISFKITAIDDVVKDYAKDHPKRVFIKLPE